MNVSTQGNMAHIGWLKYAHPVYTSQEDLLQSVKEIFSDITPHFDAICKWENKSYQTLEGETKKMRVRVLSLLCPRDIARVVSNIMFARWLNLNNPTSYWHQKAERLRKYMFIPFCKTVQFTATAQITHLMEHGHWLQQNNDVVYLEKIATLDTPFPVTQHIVDNLQFENPSSMLGTNITLQSLFNAWKKRDEKGTELPSVTAIEKINGRKFALLTHIHSVYELYEDIQRVINVMRRYPGWSDICGTRTGAVCTSPKVNPLLLNNAYLDSATTNSLGIHAIQSSPTSAAPLFNSNVRNRRRVTNPYQSKKNNHKNSPPSTNVPGTSLQ